MPSDRDYAMVGGMVLSIGAPLIVTSVLALYGAFVLHGLTGIIIFLGFVLICILFNRLLWKSA